jgi:hypothetical protein
MSTGVSLAVLSIIGKAGSSGETDATRFFVPEQKEAHQGRSVLFVNKHWSKIPTVGTSESG